MQYLLKVKGRYYFNRRVCKDMLHLFNRKEIRVALHTSDRKHAKVLLNAHSYKLEQILTIVRSGMLTDEEVRRLIADYKHETLKERDEYRLEGIGVPKKPQGYYQDGEGFNDIDVLTDVLDDRRAEIKENLAYSNFKSYEQGVDGLLEEKGIVLDKDSLEYKKLCREYMLAWIEIYTDDIEKMQGNYNNEYDRATQGQPVMRQDTAASQSRITEEKQAAGKLLSEAIEEFLQQKSLDPDVEPTTVEDYRSVLAVYKDIVGDVPVKSLEDRKKALEYAKTVQSLPRNMHIIKDYKGKPIKEVLEIAKSKNPNYARISPSTCSNRYIGRVALLFNWCVDEAHYMAWNPIRKMSKKPDPEDTNREPYSREDLKNLLDSPVIKEPPPISKAHQFFIPLIALFTGMRMNEICQLYVKDVQQIDNIWCIDVNKDTSDKRLKNKPSRRTVPIHPTLIKIGFIRYVERMREEGHDRLWIGLEYEHGNYKHKFSKWYAAYCDRHVVKDKKKVFHSFRNTLIENLQQQGLEQAMVAGIVGHKNPFITFSTYGKGYKPKPLHDVLLKLDYGLDFSGIKYPVD